MKRRDSRGRFIAKAEVTGDVDRSDELEEVYENNYGRPNGGRGGNGIFIRVPCCEYLPFFLVIFFLIVLALPWLYVIPGLLKSVIRTIARAMLGQISRGVDKSTAKGSDGKIDYLKWLKLVLGFGEDILDF